MKRNRIFTVLIILLIILNFAINRNVIVNFSLGVIAYFVAMGIRRSLHNNALALGTALILSILILPAVGYTFLWYLYSSPQSLTSEISLGIYIGQNYLYSIPSTIAGSIGDWIIEAIFG